MSFEPSNPTSGFTAPDGWEPHGDAVAIGDILRAEDAGAPEPEPPPPDPGGLRAFPGAVGYGATACIDADRSNVLIYQVINTDSSGAGSFAQACIDANAAAATALKIIIFRTGGYIDGSFDGTFTRPRITGKNIIIACQTAPGGGMAMGGPGATANNQRLTIGSGASDIIVRYLRSRNGLNASLSRRTSCLIIGDSGTTAEADHITRCYFDHCSLSWAQGIIVTNAGTTWAGASHLTFAYPILAETREEHPSGHSMGGDRELDQEQYISNAHHHTWYMWWVHSNSQRNLNHRNNQLIEEINGLMSNCDKSGWGGNVSIVDYIANYHQYGPFKTDSDGNLPPFLVLTNAYHSGTYDIPASYYAVGNISAGGAGRAAQLLDPDGDNWSNVDVSNTIETAQGLFAPHSDSHDFVGLGFSLIDFRRLERFYAPGVLDHRPHTPIYGPADFPVTIKSAVDARTEILSDEFGGGACMALDSQGRWFKRMDDVDARYRTEAQNNTGVSDHKVVTSGDYPFLSAGTAPTDSNGDGIPDDYYLFRGEDPGGPSLASQIDPNGYTFAENYINGVDHETSALRTAF